MASRKRKIQDEEKEERILRSSPRRRTFREQVDITVTEEETRIEKRMVEVPDASSVKTEKEEQPSTADAEKETIPESGQSTSGAAINPEKEAEKEGEEEMDVESQSATSEEEEDPDDAQILADLVGEPSTSAPKTELSRGDDAFLLTWARSDRALGGYEIVGEDNQLLDAVWKEDPDHEEFDKAFHDRMLAMLTRESLDNNIRYQAIVSTKKFHFNKTLQILI